MTQICVFNTRLFSLHNTLNYAIVFPSAARCYPIFRRTLLCLKFPRLLPLVLLKRRILRWSSVCIVCGIMLTGQNWRPRNKVWSSANFPPQIAHGLSQDRTLALAVRSQRITLWWSWLRIGTGGGHLWVRWWTFEFHKMRGISWLAADPVSFSRRTLLHGVSK